MSRDGGMGTTYRRITAVAVVARGEGLSVSSVAVLGLVSPFRPLPIGLPCRLECHTPSAAQRNTTQDHSMKYILVLLLALHAALAQTGAAGAASISGTVVDAKTQKPVPAALVTASR